MPMFLQYLSDIIREEYWILYGVYVYSLKIVARYGFDERMIWSFVPFKDKYIIYCPPNS